MGHGHCHCGGDDHRSSDPLRAELRKSNQLEKEIRTLRQQLNRFSEINPEEYARLQEAERQKQILEQQMELRERQMEEASAQKVAAVAAERDEAKQQILQLRKDRLLERAFSQAEGRTGGDARGTFFDIFKGQLATCFRLTTGGDGKDVLEPLDSQGKPLLGDDGRPMTTSEFLDQMRVHPVYGFLFQQRGPAGMQAAGGLTASGIGAVSGVLRGERPRVSSLRPGDGTAAPQLLRRPLLPAARPCRPPCPGAPGPAAALQSRHDAGGAGCRQTDGCSGASGRAINQPTSRQLRRNRARHPPSNQPISRQERSPAKPSRQAQKRGGIPLKTETLRGMLRKFLGFWRFLSIP
jgi:hypothetical protein